MGSVSPPKVAHWMKGKTAEMIKKKNNRARNYEWISNSINQLSPSLILSEAIRSSTATKSQRELLGSFRKFMDRTGFLTGAQKRVLRKIYLETQKTRDFKCL